MQWKHLENDADYNQITRCDRSIHIKLQNKLKFQHTVKRCKSLYGKVPKL